MVVLIEGSHGDKRLRLLMGVLENSLLALQGAEAADVGDGEGDVELGFVADTYVEAAVLDA